MMVKLYHLLAVACLFLCIDNVPGENYHFLGGGKGKHIRIKYQIDIKGA